MDDCMTDESFLLGDTERAIWLTRPDLRARLENDEEAFVGWLTLFGRNEYKALQDLDRAIPESLLHEPAPEAIQALRPRLTRLMRLFWQVSPELQEQFDISTREGQEGLVWWYLLNGVAEHGLAEQITPEQSKELNRTVSSRKGLAPITRFMVKLWEARPDLRETFDLNTAEGRNGLILWLVQNGIRELGLGRAPISLPPSLLKPAAGADSQSRPALTRLMRLVWAQRPDLQQAYDLETVTGREGLAWWSFLQGSAEMGLARFVTEKQKTEIGEPADGLTQDGVIPISRLMHKVWELRPDVQEVFDLQTAGGREQFIAWYFTRGLVEQGLTPTLTDTQRLALLEPAEQVEELPRILEWIWRANGDLQARFQDPAAPDFRLWAATEGWRDYPVLADLHDIANWRPPAANTVTAPDWPSRPFGVNLIGYARGQLGIGEDIRMAALAMEAAKIPFSIYGVEPGSNVCQGDQSAAHHLSDTLPYAINLVCMTGVETARLAAVEGRQLLEGRYSIGYWPWELPEWPPEWRHAYDLVDEVWASSRYTYEAYGRSCPKIVRHMPMAVTVERTIGLTRQQFGLPQDQFLFVFSFDMLSSMPRKNPSACIQAFRAAFPKGTEPAGLIIKAMRASPDNPDWQSLVAEAKRDRRVKLVEGTLERAVLHDFYRSCDCYVSLHRSEGFGRGMAEAMLLGKPVIATGYSGNMDFTVPGTAMLVDHRLRRVEADEYPFGEGQIWAEPDVDHAAWCMRRIAADPPLRERLAGTAQRLAQTSYAPETVGARYARTLSERFETARREIQ